MISSLGQILGEEILRVVDLTTRMDSKIRIYGSQELVECPGRRRTNTGREGSPEPMLMGIRLKSGSVAYVRGYRFNRCKSELYN